TAPTRCASPSPPSPPRAATSASIWHVSRVTATSATSCGMRRASSPAHSTAARRARTAGLWSCRWRTAGSARASAGRWPRWSGPSVMLESYPLPEDFPPDEPAEREVGWIQAFILAVRQIRGELNVNPSKRIAVLLKGASAQDRAYTERHRAYLERLASLDSVT